MLLLGYVLCDVCIMETWNTPGTECDSAHLCYLAKVARGRSTLMLVFKSRKKEKWCFILEMERHEMMILSRDLLFRS